MIAADRQQVSILADWLEQHQHAGSQATTETPDPLPHTPQVVESSASLPSPLLTKNRKQETIVVQDERAYFNRLFEGTLHKVGDAKPRKTKWEEVGPKSPTVFTGTGEGCPDVEYLPVAPPPPDPLDFMTRIEMKDLESATYEAIRESCTDSSRRAGK